MTDSEVLPAPIDATARRRAGRLATVSAVRTLPRPGWRRRYVTALITADLIGVTYAVTVVRMTGLDGSGGVGASRYIGWVSVAIAVMLLALFATGSYEVRRIAVAVEEGRRIFHGAVLAIGMLAVAALLANVALARRVALVDVAAMLCGLALARWVIRAGVRQRRRHGQWSDRVLAAGTPENVAELVRVLQRRPTAGLTVVAACLTGEQGHLPLPVPVVGAWADITAAAAHIDADVVAIAGGGQGARAARELGWALEGSGRELVTALELSDVSRSRIEIRPVDGAPLAWVGHPQFSGAVRVVKRVVDVLGALCVLLVASPIFLVVAALIKITSPGAVFFKQTRLGKDGGPIAVFKFRTMIAGAEAQRDALIEHNLASNLLYFKMRDDPRITRVGRALRRYSLDELPQLFNVLLGSMSLVGPRPLPGLLDSCDTDYRRRLLVKPGLTGLWQVSGRNDLAAEEALRLDLYYVENWSLSLDVAILVRTAWAVLRKQGAY